MATTLARVGVPHIFEEVYKAVETTLEVTGSL